MRIHRHTFLGRGEHEQIHVLRDGDNFKLSTVNTNDFEQIEIVLNRRRVIELRDRFNEMINTSGVDRQPGASVYDNMLDNYIRATGIDVGSSTPSTTRQATTSYYTARTPLPTAPGDIDNWVEMPAGVEARIVPRSYSGTPSTTPAPEELDF